MIPTGGTPLPSPTGDPRFTTGLIADLTGVLKAHGYPTLTNTGVADAVHQLLYGTAREPGSGGAR